MEPGHSFYVVLISILLVWRPACNSRIYTWPTYKRLPRDQRYVGSHIDYLVIYNPSLIRESDVCHVELTRGSEQQEVKIEEDQSRGEKLQDAIDKEELNSNQSGMPIFMIVSREL